MTKRSLQVSLRFLLGLTLLAAVLAAAWHHRPLPIVQVLIDDYQRVTVDQTTTPISTLESVLLSERKRRERWFVDTTLQLRVASDTPHSTVVQAIKDGQAAGIESIVLAEYSSESATSVEEGSKTR